MELPDSGALPRWTDLRDRYRQALTSASYLGLLAFGLRLGQPAAWRACLALIAGVGLLAWASSYKRARAIADVATSRIGSAAQGYVEIVGRASTTPSELIVSPLSGIACIWYRYRVYSKDGNRGEWREIDSGTSATTFSPDQAATRGEFAKMLYRALSR